MSTNHKLRLGPLPKTESVKLTFACPAGLKADLGALERGSVFGDGFDSGDTGAWSQSHL